MIINPITLWANLVSKDDFIGIFVDENKLVPEIRKLVEEAELPKHIEGFNLACEQDAAIAKSILKTFKEYIIYSYSSNDYYYILYDDQLAKFSNDGVIIESFSLKESSKVQDNE